MTQQTLQIFNLLGLHHVAVKRFTDARVGSLGELDIVTDRQTNPFTVH
jgi:hypothetical protein